MQGQILSVFDQRGTLGMVLLPFGGQAHLCFAELPLAFAERLLAHRERLPLLIEFGPLGGEGGMTPFERGALGCGSIDSK